MNETAVINLMMERQGLAQTLPESEYERVFSLFSPVHTRFWIRPGVPPVIQHRFSFDTEDYNRALRRDRTIIKGRFQSGRIGYVMTEELPLFVAAYGKPLKEKTFTEELVLRVLQDEGPMSIKMMAEICEAPSKYVAAALKRLQQAFIVFEDQTDDEWDRAWYLLEDELGIDDINAFTKEEAAGKLVERFVHAHVFATPAMVRAFTGFTAADVKAAFLAGEQSGKYKKTEYLGETGYILAADAAQLSEDNIQVPYTLFIMDNNDFLVRAHTQALKKRFAEKPYKNLFYVLYKGRFIGALQGRFTFSFDELEDVKLLDEYADNAELKTRIIQKIYEIYDPETSPLMRYAGQPING